MNIKQSFSALYTPELNGIDEGVNHTTVKAARCHLIQTNFPNYPWPFAQKHVIFVSNHVKHFRIAKTPT